MKCLIAWMLVVFWMAVIFYFSSQPAVQSAKLSTHVTQLTISFFGVNMGIDALEHYIRKSAHFLIFLMLGGLTLHALKWSRVSRATVVAFVICVFYAISDELHQLFALGRSAQVRDVLIDSVGAAMGIILCVLLIKLVVKINYLYLARKQAALEDKPARPQPSRID
ncbi:VanZ family protein [Acetobacterium fimetarium]|uniref:VanZ family protein n=2 Tax=Acetobacterium fimetarium TaxID=52691 RepID=A0ABR6WWU9_9FIRM|nr:VanZ family protein [Acetobacterium fimetarium]